ncbi:hypothetical protein PTI98_010164 [Pleurotus ostreatus]|nr:hypothetical protein PTI98_010164 [Pleurotus ostreatus]
MGVRYNVVVPYTAFVSWVRCSRTIPHAHYTTKLPQQLMYCRTHITVCSQSKHRVFTVFNPKTTTVVENAAAERIESLEWNDVWSTFFTLENAPPMSSSV